MKRLTLTLVLIAFVSGTQADGHHSFSAVYAEDQTGSIEGEIVRFDYGNPHSWVYVMAPDAEGTVQRFGAEWANPNRLRRQGITAATLQVGDYVIVSGSPARDSNKFDIHLKGIERPSDGWKWEQARNRGRGRGRR